MTVRGVLLFLILTGLCVSSGWAGPATEGVNPESVAAYETEISAAKDKNEEALLRKKLGDYYASREDYENGAREFLKALSLSPSRFTPQERIQMAVAISWADRPNDAIPILRSILVENGENRQARIELARALLLADRLDEAEKEADAILKEEPDTQEALLVKANALLWRGEAASSIPVYEKALAVEENFDARIGLASACLAIGEKDKAREIAKTLKPVQPYQRQELVKFSDSLCGVRAPSVGVAYSYYWDKDRNIVNRYTLFGGTWFGSKEVTLSYRLTEARGSAMRGNAEDLWIAMRAPLGKDTITAGVGLDRVGDSNSLYGKAGIEGTRDWWSYTVAASRETLNDTAEIIENRIARTSGAVSLSEKATNRLSFSESYARSSFSDGNDSDDLQLMARYILLHAPVGTTAGYRFRYWDFRRQSHGGYFDPSHFNSHQVFLSFSAEYEGWYLVLEPYAGYQTFLRNGTETRGDFAGYYGAAGWRMKKCTAFELAAEGGNYAAGAAAGFNYYQVGFKFIQYF